MRVSHHQTEVGLRQQLERVSCATHTLCLWLARSSAAEDKTHFGALYAAAPAGA